jgi:hypothetical protein
MVAQPLICGPMPATADAIIEWATCSFMILMTLVVVTIAVLFIIGLLVFARFTRKI